MNKGVALLIGVGLLGIMAAIGVYEYLGRQHGTSPVATIIRDAIRTERIVTPEEAAQKAAETQAPGARKKAAPPAAVAAAATRPDEPVRTSVTPPPDFPPVPPPAPPPAPAVSRPSAALTVGVAQRRIDTFVAGSRPEWSGYDILFDKPLLVRAGGSVRAGETVSGPGGVLEAGTSAPAGRVRALPGAPHLALIGRVCSTEICSPPFVVGARTVLCPSQIGVTGDLQLWINNDIQVDGYQTVAAYRDVAGGFRFEVEPATPEACDEPGPAPAAATATVSPRETLERGDVLRSDSFTVSARQNAWKPFFLPMDRPLVIRASGQMQPYERTRSTGPNGVPVTGLPWTYPGTKTITVDADHALIVPALPYQALIGRLCSATSCGEPFLVGAERTLCPNPQFDDRLELWINHIMARSGPLQVPFADLAFQGRRGEYRFELAPAPAGACGAGR